MLFFALKKLLISLFLGLRFSYQYHIIKLEELIGSEKETLLVVTTRKTSKEIGGV